MLSAEDIVEIRDKPPPGLPTIGTKDFEPDGSLEQSCQIKHSLSEIENIISHRRVKSLNALSKAIWKPELHLAEVTHQTGSHWTHMGHKVGQQLHIYPEEALYLLETGALELLYNEVSLSIQRAYGILLEESDFSIEKYRVYSLLNSHGYKVLKHSPQNTVTKYEKKIEIHKIGLKLKKCAMTPSTGKRPAESECQTLESKRLKISEEKTFPVGCNSDEDGREILKKIQVIQPHVDNTETTLTFDYDVYSDTVDKHSFKKSCLQLPTYRVIIHRGEEPMPDLNELCKLSNKYKDEVPVVHAVVFCDYIAFYKINPVLLPDLSN